MAGSCVRTAGTHPKACRVHADAPLPPVKRFRETLQKLGWVEGKNLIIEFRYGEGNYDRYSGFAAELVSMPVDVLVVWGTPAAFAAKRATTTISILIAAAGDVVKPGLFQIWPDRTPTSPDLPR